MADYFTTVSGASNIIDAANGAPGAVDAFPVYQAGTGVSVTLSDITSDDTVCVSINPCNTCDYSLLVRWQLFANAVAGSTNGGLVRFFLRHCCC